MSRKLLDNVVVDTSCIEVPCQHAFLLSLNTLAKGC